MTKSIFVNIVGRTNAGKSSLLNAIIGEKIASVSEKTQTTRTKITGVLTKGDIQMVFVDTPGLHKPKNKLSEQMLKTVNASADGMDVILFMADCTRRFAEQERNALLSFSKSKTPIIMILNKIDLIRDKVSLIEMIAKLNAEFNLKAIIPISVLENDGIDIVLDEVKKLAVESPHFFPDDMLTDQPERVIAGEIVREKLLNLLDDEVPHGIAVVVEEMKERTNRNGDDILDISANIFCEKDSHKGIVIGKNGAMLKKASSLARVELEEFFEIKVNLQCWVKVKDDWRNREGIIRTLGLSDK